jgi:hypothetical protein
MKTKTNTKKNLLFDLPYELQVLIFEFNSEHRYNFFSSLLNIKKSKFCDYHFCKKIIIKKNYGWIWGYSKSLCNYCSEQCRKKDINIFEIDVY